MVTLTAPPTAAPRRTRPPVRVFVRGTVAAIGHATMIVAMIPCLLGGTSAEHIGAALLLFTLAASHAPRARSDPGALAPVVDALAMAVLSVAGALHSHAAQLGEVAASGHSHAGPGIVGAAAIMAVLTVVGWLALRLSIGPRVGRVSRRGAYSATSMSAAMVMAMALTTLVHSL